ncbi:hypothetical protein [Streptomyces sp. NPDC001492]
MSKHGPCRTCPEPAVAWIRLADGSHVRLCKPCLDAWFDMADDMPHLEPRIWGWFVRPAGPSAEAVAAWARNPANHQDVAAVLRMEARINPDWLRNFVARMHRAHGVSLVRT